MILRAAAAKRAGIKAMTSFAGWVGRNQRIAVPHDGTPVKVNLGCGIAVAPGWLNVDGSLSAWVANRPPWLHQIAYRFTGSREFYGRNYYCDTLRNNTFIHHNLQYGIPLDDGGVDFIFCSHFLEHLDQSSGKFLMQECRRVVKDTGVVRIVVPDLEFAWELYKRGEKALMLHDYFFAGEEDSFSKHRYAYDYEMLAELCKSVGFTRVYRRNYREGLTPDLELLDNRPEYSLYIEALP